MAYIGNLLVHVRRLTAAPKTLEEQQSAARITFKCMWVMRAHL